MNSFRTRIAMTVTHACGTGAIIPHEALPGFCALHMMRPEWRGKSLRYVLRFAASWETADGTYDETSNSLSRVTSNSSDGGASLNIDGRGTWDLLIVGLTEDAEREDAFNAHAAKLCADDWAKRQAPNPVLYAYLQRERDSLSTIRPRRQ